MTDESKRFQYDVVIVGGTPGGIMAAIAVARGGYRAVILERSRHLGGLPANGLGATDIQTRGATGGLFLEFTRRVRQHYIDTYGPASDQVRDCSDGYHFEPQVAERILAAMLADYPDQIDLRLERQFDVEPDRVVIYRDAVSQVTVINRQTGQPEQYTGHIFIDATYEGDLAAAAGAPYRLGREGKLAYHEPMAGRLYKRWRGPVGSGSTGLGDNAIQSYNYRLCLTNRPQNRILISKPPTYNRAEYQSLVTDILANRTTGDHQDETAFGGIGRVVNMVSLPNGKTDANNQHLAFLSTDLPEENWPWPTSSWAWRDQFAHRLRDYTLGLLWFVQNDSDLPPDFRERCRNWGLAADEYTDNDHFPRQVYVREGRRIEGEHLFLAHDALPVSEGCRPPIHSNSITASHYALDSHAVRKREPDRVHLDGFFSYPSVPYTVPYGVIIPQLVDGLLTPVPVSGTHIGFSTLRMEPCWMALGQAAGVAACLCLAENVQPRDVDVTRLQQQLLQDGAVLIYFQDVGPDNPHFTALQYFAVRGFYRISEWQAGLTEPVPAELAEYWIRWAAVGRPESYTPGHTTRGDLLSQLYERTVR